MGCLLGHPRMTKKEQNMPITSVDTTITCSRQSLNMPTHVANRNCLRSKSATPVAHLLVCSTIFWRDFDSAGDPSRLRLRPANLRWSHCSQCQVWWVALSPMAARTTLMESSMDGQLVASSRATHTFAVVDASFLVLRTAFIIISSSPKKSACMSSEQDSPTDQICNFNKN